MIRLLLHFTGAKYQCLLLHNSKYKVQYPRITKNKNNCDRNNSSCVMHLNIKMIVIGITVLCQAFKNKSDCDSDNSSCVMRLKITMILIGIIVVVLCV